MGTSYSLCMVFFQLYELVSVLVNSVLGFQGNFLIELILIVIHDGIKFPGGRFGVFIERYQRSYFFGPLNFENLYFSDTGHSCCIFFGLPNK